MLIWCYGMQDIAEDFGLPWEPARHGEIATGSVSKCKEFWRTFVTSSVMMEWIQHGYALL